MWSEDGAVGKAAGLRNVNRVAVAGSSPVGVRDFCEIRKRFSRTDRISDRQTDWRITYIEKIEIIK